MATTATIPNVTVSGNTSSGGGGIGISENADVGIANSVVWSNTGTEIMLQSSSASVTYSDIQGGYTGVGNINADPLFIDVSSGNY